MKRSDIVILEPDDALARQAAGVFRRCFIETYEPLIGAVALTTLLNARGGRNLFGSSAADLRSVRLVAMERASVIGVARAR